MAEDTKTIVHERDHPVKIRLNNNGKGGYSWEIYISGHNADEILPQLHEIDGRLKAVYPLTKIDHGKKRTGA